MFGLLESCKLNKVNFCEYIEDILTRILCGEEVDASFLPCDYVRHFEDGADAEVTKTSKPSLDCYILENQNFIQKYRYG